MRPATESDYDWILAHLRQHICTSMFPLHNLAEHGWESDAPRGMRFWLDRDREALLGMSAEGMLMPQVPSLDMRSSEILKGRRAKGAVGEAGQVAALLETLGLDCAPMKMNEAEPQFDLDLAQLRLPEGPGTLIPISEADQDVVRRWRAAYLVELMGDDPTGAWEQAGRDIARYAKADSHRVLMVDGRPVAMTGFNAHLPQIVQIGGVFTPSELRGRGYARRAVALHLAEAQEAGATKATLFAASDSAVRAYAALGFTRIGSFSIVMFKTPPEIGA